MAGLLLYLAPLASPAAKVLFTSLLFWAAACLDSCPAVATASEDPTEAAVLGGPMRTRRLDRALKDHVASLGSEPALARSGAHAMEQLQRTRPSLRRCVAHACNSLLRPRVGRYLQTARSLWQAASPSTLCISWDATRLGGKDTLWFCLCGPGFPHGFYAPPQAPSLV